MHAQQIDLPDMGVCLVVDDDSFDRNMMRRCLGRDRPGMTLHACDTITAARGVLARTRPDVILLDHRLPDGEGAGFAAELRADPTLEDTMICVVTHTDLRQMDPAVPVLSKAALSPQSIRALVEAFLAERRIARGSADARLVSAFGGHVQDNTAPAVSRMMRVLRSARQQSRRSIPRAAMQDLDTLEEMLLAFSDTLRREK
jgi:CheY-like chemotaxis protein